MMNYMVIDEKHIQIEHGILGEVSSFHTYPTGELESVKLAGENMVVTYAGELVPAYTETPRRKNKPSLEFHKNGLVKAVMLEEQKEIETPIGVLPVEHVVFYPTGELHRVFITNGQISGFWSEEDEKQFNIPLNFEFEFGKFTAYLSSICFYQTGEIKSITLYPGEKVVLNSPAGEIETGVGFSLYEDGSLESIEPSSQIVIDTPIGRFMAYNPDALGIHAESNSVRFDSRGRLTEFTTVDNKILVQTDASEFFILKPEEGVHPLYDDQMVKKPMNIKFDFEKDIVTIQSDKAREFSMKTTEFIIHTIESDTMGCSPIDCASCSMCNS